MHNKRRKLVNTTVYRPKGRKRLTKKSFLFFLLCALIAVLALGIKERMPDYSRVGGGTVDDISGSGTASESAEILGLEEIPPYDGRPYCEVRGNDPAFTEIQTSVLKNAGYEYYSSLDGNGRCGYCEACVGPETLPEEGREDIFMVHPSGWRSGQGWERCHLVGFQLTGESANDHNLITGCHSFNVDGMLPFENEVAYAARRGIHVMYRVTPLYKGSEPICRGVQMQAQSIEDDSVRFNVFVYNCEPGKEIDYVNGYIY